MTDLITATSPFDALKQVRADGSEFWSARDLMSAVNYDNWQNFENAIGKAAASCFAQGQIADHHFIDASKVIEGGRWGTQTVEDVELSRFACYLTVMNGDPRKPEIAAAQGYFAVKTREAETARSTLTGPALMAAALIEAHATLEAKDQEIAVLAPKAEAFDGFIGSEGDYTFNQAAKLLQRRGVETGQFKLVETLLEWKWIYRGEKNRPRAYQTHISNGRLAEKTHWFIDQSTGEKCAGATQVRITPKGVDDIAKKLSLKVVTTA